MSVLDLALRTTARHVGRHLPNVPLRHRIAAAIVLCVGGLMMWYLTDKEVYYKVFEFSSAPFVDKLLFELGLTSE